MSKAGPTSFRTDSWTGRRPVRALGTNSMFVGLSGPNMSHTWTPVGVPKIFLMSLSRRLSSTSDRMEADSGTHSNQQSCFFYGPDGAQAVL
jgi:hypothetical protein